MEQTRRTDTDQHSPVKVIRQILLRAAPAVLLFVLLTVLTPPVTVHAVTDPGLCPTGAQHEWGGWQTTREATCESAGQRTRWCSNCPSENVATTSALGHSWTTAYTNPATCTNYGETVYSCTRCGKTDSDSIAPTGHSYYEAVSTQPTCTAAGTKSHVCGRCGDTRTESLPALGHNMVKTVTKAPTCTAAGSESDRCSRCGQGTDSALPALGHDYRTTVERAATCTEKGREVTRCSRCNDTKTKDLDALGHDYEDTITKPTCTKDGLKASLCSRCGDETEETIEATGHDYSDPEITAEPACEEDGLQKSKCKSCGEILEEVLPKTGHFYPEEWTLEQSSGFFREGLESKTCPNCATRLEQVIPKKSKTPLALGGCTLLLLGGGGGFFWKRKRLLADPELNPPETEQTDFDRDVEKQSGVGLLGALFGAAGAGAGAGGAAAKAANGVGKPPLETKKVVVCSENAALLKLFGSKRFIKDTVCTPERLLETVSEAEPDLVICSIDSKERLDEVTGYKKGALSEIAFGLVVDEQVLNANKGELEQLKKEQKGFDYMSSSFSEHAVLVRLVAPLLKPDPKSDGTLEGIGIVADLLGIPGVSTVIEAFTSGREIKETVQKSGLSKTDHVTIISDIANILGFDTAADVLELLTDVKELKDNKHDTAADT